jgi:hypothetical protein
MSVVGLTGNSGIVNFGPAVPNPTITQTFSGATTGQTMTLKAQNGSIFGGNAVLQSGTATTAGLVQFLVGNTTAAYFDSNFAFRLGPNASSTVNGPNGTAPVAGTDFIYGNNAAGSMWLEFFSGATTQRAGIALYNNTNAGAGVSGISVQAPGPTYSTFSSYAGNGVIEQSGTTTSALILGKTQGDGTGRAVSGRVWQSGAFTFGDSGLNNTSSNAQAGVLGTVLNISPNNGGAITGTITPTSTQSQCIIFNQYSNNFSVYGILTLQGHIGVNLMSNTTSVATTTTTKFITQVGRTIKVRSTTVSANVTAADEVISIGTLAAPITITLPAGPATGDTYTVKDANGSANANTITVSGNGVNIDGLSSILLTTNYTQATFVYNGSTWISSLTNNLLPNGFSSTVAVASSGSTTVVGFDELVLCDPTSASCTVNAPAAPGTNQRFTVKDQTAQATPLHFITVSGNGKQIEDPNNPGIYASSVNITAQSASVTFAYDPFKTRWMVV